MKLEKIIIILGPPGSGKGTQSELLARKFGYEHFSTGVLSREYAKQDTELGKKIKSIIDQGIILPIEIIREIFVKKFESLAGAASGIILDGYPRTIEQLKLLEELLATYDIQNVVALFLSVDKDDLIQRIAGRKTCVDCQAMYKRDMPEYGSGICGKCGGGLTWRADDDPAVIEKRFEEYMLKTAPVREYYEQKGILILINGNQPIEDTHQEILSKLGLA